MWNVRRNIHAIVHPVYVLICHEHSTILWPYFISSLFFFQSHNQSSYFIGNWLIGTLDLSPAKSTSLMECFIVASFRVLSFFRSGPRFPGKIFPRDPLSALCISNIVFVLHLWRDHSLRRGIPFQFAMKMTKFFVPDTVNLYNLKISRNFLSLTKTSRWQGINDNGSRKRATLVVITFRRLIIATFNDWNANWPLDKLVGPLQFIGTGCEYYSVDH